MAARQVGKALGDAERWNVVVENKPGGAANIGAAHVSHATPDGHTWLAITLSHAANATLFAGRAGYDLIRDLTPLAGLASSPIMVVVNAKSNIRSMEDLARGPRQTAVGGFQRQWHAAAPDAGAVPEADRHGADARALQGWRALAHRPDRRAPGRSVFQLSGIAAAREGRRAAGTGHHHARTHDRPARGAHRGAGRPAGPHRRELHWRAGAGEHAAGLGEPNRRSHRPANVTARLATVAGATGLRAAAARAGGLRRLPESGSRARIIRDANIQIA